MHHMRQSCKKCQGQGTSAPMRRWGRCRRTAPLACALGAHRDNVTYHIRMAPQHQRRRFGLVISSGTSKLWNLFMNLCPATSWSLVFVQELGKRKSDNNSFSLSSRRNPFGSVSGSLGPRGKVVVCSYLGPRLSPFRVGNPELSI